MPNTILYIEDDPASRSLVERTLRYGGYRVLIADCALDGIDMARREMPDLILTDINLPDMSGREVTTMLRSEAALSHDADCRADGADDGRTARTGAGGRANRLPDQAD